MWNSPLDWLQKPQPIEPLENEGIMGILQAWRDRRAPRADQNGERCVHVVAELCQRGEVHRAVRRATSYQRRCPIDPRTACNCAIEISEAGSPEAAVTILERAVQSNGPNEFLFVNLSVALQRCNQIPDAVEAARKACELAPKDAAMRQQLIDVLRDDGSADEASEHLVTLLEDDPQSINLLMQLGVVGMQLRHHAHAEEAFRKTLEADPEHSFARANLAAALLGLGHIDEAEGHALRALKMRPEDGVSLCNIALVRERQGRLGEALELYERAVTLDPEYEPAAREVARVRKQILDNKGR